MGLKKKQAPRNAFYFYMIEYKEDAESRGTSFPGGLKDVAEAASPSWKELSSDEKARYENMAKQWKAEQRGDASMKYTTTGISYAEVDQKIREEEEERIFVVKSIERDIQNLTTQEALGSKFFYLIHVNYYCLTSKQNYLPAEIAISEFSIKTGVNRVYHTFVNPGTLPIGDRSSAEDHIKATHQIPLNFVKGEIQYLNIFDQITTFIKANASSDDELPPLYTMPDSINHHTSMSAVKSTLQVLCDTKVESGTGQNTPVFNVFLLEKLFFELRNACAYYCQDEDEPPVFKTTGIPTMELEKEVFSSTYNLACEYHQDVDRGVYCSLSKVIGWAYLICDFCCQDLGVELKPGKHCPDLVDRNYLKKRDNGGRGKPTSFSGLRKQPTSGMSRPTPRTQNDEWSLPKKEFDGNAWVTHSASDNEKSPSAPENQLSPSAWGVHSTSSSRPISASSIVSGSSGVLDFSEANFPSMGRGRGTRNAGAASRITSGMRGMNLKK